VLEQKYEHRDLYRVFYQELIKKMSQSIKFVIYQKSKKVVIC